MDNNFLLRENISCSKVAFFSRLVYHHLSFSQAHVSLVLCPPTYDQNSDFCLDIDLCCLYFPSVKYYQPSIPYLSPQTTAAIHLFLCNSFLTQSLEVSFVIFFLTVNCDYVNINGMIFLISSSLLTIFMKD